jgi:hypothetical protein
MAKETLIVESDEMSEYSLFGWTFEKNTPEGKAVLSRDNEDPEVKKFMNQEMKYRSVKTKIKKLEKPELPKGMSGGVKLLIAILLFPIGLLIYLYKPGQADYERDLREYNKNLRDYEDQLEEIRLSKQYQ